MGVANRPEARGVESVSALSRIEERVGARKVLPFED